MDRNDLRYFLAISRTGTLLRASKEPGVEHTTVGRRWAALKSALDARLFAREAEARAGRPKSAAVQAAPVEEGQRKPKRQKSQA